jgi:anti-sigma B factor antagonist
VTALESFEYIYALVGRKNRIIILALATIGAKAMPINKLELAERENAGAAVIEIIGELTIASSTERVLNAVRKNLEAGRRLILINLAGCRRLDSSGIGELVTSLVTSARHDANLHLTNVPQQIRGLLKMTNVHKAFQIFDTEEAALAASASSAGDTQPA